MESMRSIRRRRGDAALHSLVAGTIVSALAATGLVACGGSSGQHAATGTSFRVIQGSRVKSYSSIAELSADSQLIVAAVATTSRTTTSIQELPFTVTVLNVRTIFKGAAPASIKLRQLGDATTQTSDEMDALVIGGTAYVLFLNVFTFGPGQDTDQDVVVGGSAGMYSLQGQTLRHVRGPDPLPQTLSLADLTSAIAG